jgi:hypothetical protein
MLSLKSCSLRSWEHELSRREPALLDHHIDQTPPADPPYLRWGSVPIALERAHEQGNVRGAQPPSTPDAWEETKWISALTDA